MYYITIGFTGMKLSQEKVNATAKEQLDKQPITTKLRFCFILSAW